MATTVREPTTVALGDERRLAPVVVWAGVGAGFVLMFAYTMSRWLFSGTVKRVPSGPSKQADWQLAVLHGIEVTVVVTFVLTVYFVTIRPWRRSGRPTSLGLLVIAGVFGIWQDQGFSYFKVAMLYNTNFLQWGSWFTYIPGWMSERVPPQPLLWIWPCWAFYFAFGAILGNQVMRRTKERFPRIGTFGLLLTVWIFFLVFEIIVESLWLRTTAYAYPAAWGPVLFKGHYYQLPLLMPLVFSVSWAAWGPLFYFRDDKGYTLVERGIDTVRATPLQKVVLRTLALCAAVNLTYLGFNVVYGIAVAHGGAWPEDVVKRSYLTGGLCGPGTNLACPDGKLVVLPGTKLPSDH